MNIEHSSQAKHLLTSLSGTINSGSLLIFLPPPISVNQSTKSNQCHIYIKTVVEHTRVRICKTKNRSHVSHVPHVKLFLNDNINNKDHFFAYDGYCRLRDPAAIP